MNNPLDSFLNTYFVMHHPQSPTHTHTQRQLMEAYVRQKRAQPGMVLASDVPATLMRPGTASGSAAKLVQSPQSPHAYDGPLQFTMSPHNPDQMRSLSPDHDGMCFGQYCVAFAFTSF